MKTIFNRIIVFLYFIFLIFLPTCNFKKNNINKINFRYKSSNSLNLKIYGVECKYCARTAINLLESTENILKAEFIQTSPEPNFEGFMNIYLKNNKNNLDIQKIKQLFYEEGFYIKEITGDFYGMIVKLNSEDYFKIGKDEKNLFKIEAPLDKKNFLLIYNKLFFMRGKLIYNKNLDRFKFVLH